MGARKNNRVAKRDFQHYDGHNRKPGRSATTKAGRNRRGRRNGTLTAKKMISDYVPHVFKQ